MDKLPLNVVDIGVVGVILISALLAFSRGLVREVLSIGAWVLAALATIYGLPHLDPPSRAELHHPRPWSPRSSTGIDDLHRHARSSVPPSATCVARNVRSSGFGAIDRSLGLLFGIVRGAVLVCLAYLAFIWADAEAGRPA